MIVLLIEDEEDDQNTYRKLVERACPGAEVYIARDSIKTRDHLRKVKPHLAIVDIWLGGTTNASHGIEIIQEMRTKKRTKNIMIFALTVAVSDEMERMATDAGCDRFFRKKQDDVRLEEAVRHLCRTIKVKQK
ncbi:MAG: response regulator [Syntrophaceae bacterium]|nr:response regulator [Syntrophaceae bacterium]